MMCLTTRGISAALCKVEYLRRRFAKKKPEKDFRLIFPVNFTFFKVIVADSVFDPPSGTPHLVFPGNLS